MSDIEKLAKLADQADGLLSLVQEVHDLRDEIIALRADKNRALSTKEAAEILDVSPGTVVNWVNRGMIPAIMSKNGYRIPAGRIFAIAEREAERRAMQSHDAIRLV